METVNELTKVTNAKELIIEGCNTIKVIAGTTGIKGGDTGHGGRTILRIVDEGSTDMRASFNGSEMYPCNDITIAFGGDSELEAFVNALHFALNAYGLRVAQHSEKQENNFYLYLCELIGLYEATGSLKGMSKIRDMYKVTGITKEEFFQYELNKTAILLPEEASRIYKLVKSRK